MSDITGLAQDVPAVTVGAAYGDTLLAAQAVGLVSPGTDWARTAREVRPRHDPLYDELYVAYRALHESTVELQHQLAEVARRPPERSSSVGQSAGALASGAGASLS
jgi:xylulokinase